MSNLMHSVQQHLSDDVIMQLSRQVGAQDPNQVKSAAFNCAELLLNAISRNANNQDRGSGLYGAIEKDHDGGILGNLMGILSGKQQVENKSTMNGEAIIGHLLGKQQLEAAQLISQASGLNFFKSGVLMQLIAPIVMGTVGQTRKSSGFDLGGLAKVLMGGTQQQQQSQGGGGLGSVFGKLLDRDGDGSMMDDLLNIGMNMMKK